MAKSAQRIKARKLRQQGRSIRYISNNLNISKSSVSLWCQDIALTNTQIKRLEQNSRKGSIKGSCIAAKNKQLERQERVRHYNRIGLRQIGQINQRDLLIIGAALYWAEGTKKTRRVVFCNSDPDMIKLIIKWLTKCLNINHDRLKCYVGINQIHKSRIHKVQQYWSKVTQIPLHRFSKTSFKKVKNQKIYLDRSNHYGTLSLEVKRGTNLNYQILGQIQQLKSQA